MGKIDLSKIEKLFQQVGIIRGNYFLLSARDAIELIMECRRIGVGIVGIGGFRVFGDKLQPLQEHEIDYVENRPENILHAIEFIKERSCYKELWFHVYTVEAKE